MKELHIIRVDLAKRVFQVHGADRAGHVLFRKKLSRPQFKKFLFETPYSVLIAYDDDGIFTGRCG